MLITGRALNFGSDEDSHAKNIFIIHAVYKASPKGWNLSVSFANGLRVLFGICVDGLRLKISGR